MTYQVKLLKSEEGYAVWCPVLLGCGSQGATEAEALEKIRDAIPEYLAASECMTSNPEPRGVDSGTAERPHLEPSPGALAS